MTPKTKEMQIWMRDPKTNKSWLVTFQSFKQELGVCNLEERAGCFIEEHGNLWKAINDIREILVSQYVPQAQMRLCKLLSARETMNTRQISQFIDSEESTIMRWALWEAWQDLIRKGVVGHISKGKGIPRVWFLRDQEEES